MYMIIYMIIILVLKLYRLVKVKVNLMDFVCFVGQLVTSVHRLLYILVDVIVAIT